MSFYRLEGRIHLLPEDIWGGAARAIALPRLPACHPPAEPWFWVTGGRGRRLPLAWPGGTALGSDGDLLRQLTPRCLRSPRPLMSRVPFHPHRIPPAGRRAVRFGLAALSGLLGPRRRAFPRWPIEPSVEVWKAILECCGLPVAQFPWPHKKRFALCLSHDVDTAGGQRNVLALAQIEESLGVRSAWFLAPGNYRVDRGLWREMAARGHEIASHGWAHDFRLAYLARRPMAERLERSAGLLAEFGVVGFRSPGFLRTPKLMEVAGERFQYDSSVADTLRLHGPDGCGSIFPFRIGTCIEIPVTLPYDGELLAFRLHRSERLALWAAKAKWIRQRRGMIHLLTHPDPQFTASEQERDLYRRFLEMVLEYDSELWHGLPREIASLAAGHIDCRAPCGQKALAHLPMNPGPCVSAVSSDR